MLSDTIRTTLLSSATLTGLLTGGIYTEGSEGRNGISPEATPAAYDDDGYLLPCALVHVNGEHPWGGGHDSAAQYKTLRGLIEVYLYDNGDNLYTTLEAAAVQVETLLDEQRIVGVGALKTLNTTFGRDPDVENAIMIRIDYQAVRGGSSLPDDDHIPFVSNFNKVC